MMLCRWCHSDYYDHTGRCARCNQPLVTCNEVAGRTFRMTWDDRIDYNAETDEWPRMPPHRAEPVVDVMRRIRFEHMTSEEIVRFLVEQVAFLSRATGVPRDVLFGTPTFFHRPMGGFPDLDLVS